MALKAVDGAKSPSKGRRGIGKRPAADEVGGAAGGVGVTSAVAVAASASAAGGVVDAGFEGGVTSASASAVGGVAVAMAASASAAGGVVDAGFEVGVTSASAGAAGAAGGVEEGSGASSVRAMNASTRSDRTAWPGRGASTRNPLGPTRQPGARLREPGCGARRGSSPSLPHSARCLAGGDGEKGIDALFIDAVRIFPCKIAQKHLHY